MWGQRPSNGRRTILRMLPWNELDVDTALRNVDPRASNIISRNIRRIIDDYYIELRRRTAFESEMRRVLVVSTMVTFALVVPQTIFHLIAVGGNSDMFHASTLISLVLNSLLLLFVSAFCIRTYTLSVHDICAV